MSIIILWMIGFSLIHSITADKRFKDWVAQIISERFRHGWYRLFYNALSVISLAPLFLYMANNAVPIYSVPRWLVPIFLIIQLIGVIGLVISILQIDWMRFAGFKQIYAYLTGKPLPLANEPLQTKGLYAFVRHPLYLFSLLFLWFSPTLTNTGLVFNILATLYFVFGSIIEEKRMISYYGESYTKYQQDVPWLIPFIRI